MPKQHCAEDTMKGLILAEPMYHRRKFTAEKQSFEGQSANTTQIRVHLLAWPHVTIYSRDAPSNEVIIGVQSSID